MTNAADSAAINLAHAWLCSAELRGVTPASRKEGKAHLAALTDIAKRAKGDIRMRAIVIGSDIRALVK